ncbi:hypothetical protein BO99DRAFT_34583 [Aspergillus violaceofuscus CBS 115571]|uniref:Uncharacterized protein n=1 Tax=Aspergillus violaceofuscus (strain CBS 115571) TaxID=1450538 RepID=A0A2V5GXT5_ASPV1|nr:hypothetical protein BO99DRAFT_34583 [Aspergillus violaceofuscus CBS 115571]
MGLILFGSPLLLLFLLPPPPLLLLSSLLLFLSSDRSPNIQFPLLLRGVSPFLLGSLSLRFSFPFLPLHSTHLGACPLQPPRISLVCPTCSCMFCFGRPADSRSSRSPPPTFGLFPH